MFRSRKLNMRSLTRLSVGVTLAMMLVSCAGTGPREDDVSQIKSSREYVQVDSDVQSDFDSAIVLMQQEQYAQAAAVLKSVLEREQRLPAPYVNLAIAQRKLDDDKSAEENLINALKIDLHHPVANNELGLLYRKAGKFKAARTAYENAIKENPDYLPAKRNLGVLCDLYMHDFECALRQFEDYLEYRPDDKTVQIWVADVRQRLGG